MTSRDALRSAFPAEGLFAEKEWLLSPEPFPLTRAEAEEITAMGWRLHLFLKACNALYLRSARGKIAPWIAEWLDAGKPAELIAQARSAALRDELPRVIRPDLLLGEAGFALSEVDSVPGGIGLTAWLNQTYSTHGGWDVIGGPRGMIDGFRSLFPPAAAGVDLAVSEEAGSYRPEMEWLAQQLGPAFQVVAAETYRGDRDRAVYRFFELFDLPNLPLAAELLDLVAAGRVKMTAPPKPWLEEKLWMALFHLRPLRDLWRRELTENQHRRLTEYIPYSWLVDPTPLPPHAVLPRLDVHSWAGVAAFSQKQRELVLKRSGFHPEAWGARSVTIGHDVPQAEWSTALAGALADHPGHPFVLQAFHRARVVEHPFFDPATGLLRTLRGRVRLCPYFFHSAVDATVRLGGILATICPEDKKILHGMKDAILVPCRIGEAVG
jgi:hypothetical protein